MSRIDRLCALLLAGIVAAALVACGGNDEAPPAARERTQQAAPAPAQASPAPDFQSYVLGDLPDPDAVPRDPFSDVTAPPPTAGPVAVRPKPAPALRGIVLSKGRYVALLDGGAAGQGETIRGWKITEIDARSVTLTRGRRVVRRAL